MSREDFIVRRAAAKRASVLAAARIRFASDGLDGANVERIAQDAGVSTATLYRQFPSKIALFEAALAQGLTEFEDRLGAGATLTPRARIANLAHAYAALLEDPVNAGMLRAVFAAAPVSPEVTRIFYERVKSVIAGAFNQAVEAAIEAGLVVRARQPIPPGGHLMGVIEHASIWRRMLTGEDGEHPPAAIAEVALRTFWAAFGTPKSTRTRP
jgi:TetR/AcrR family transcriptional regulator, regulator of autoinduction and epiphytic fitness